MQTLSTPSDIEHNGYALLSKREKKVLELSSYGYSASEVADRLGLAPDTIRSYLKSAYRKLGARNRTHAVAIYIRISQQHPPLASSTRRTRVKKPYEHPQPLS